MMDYLKKAVILHAESNVHLYCIDKINIKDYKDEN